MSLTGNLEDLPLLDILQIVSFSKKTGALLIRGADGEGAIVFSDGFVVAGFAPGLPPLDPRAAQLDAQRREALVRNRIELALGQLIRLRSGQFEFSLNESAPKRVGGREIAGETLEAGINPQELLLDLARGMDEDRRDSSAALEASFAELGETAEDALEPAPGRRDPAPEYTALRETVPEYTIPLHAVPEAVLSAPPAQAAAPAAASEPVAPQATAPREDTVPPGHGRAAVEPPPDGDDTVPPGRSSPRPAVTGEAPGAAQPAPGPAPAVAAAPPRPEAGDEQGIQALLLVDDEEDVRRILAQSFTQGGYQVVEAEDPDSALKKASRLSRAGISFVLVTDLGMPSSGGSSFQGGFEVVKRLAKMRLDPPVLMMTETLSPAVRARARQMGVSGFVFKPSLSKLDPLQHQADLREFARGLLENELAGLARRGGGAARPAGPAALPAEKEEAARDLKVLQQHLAELRGSPEAGRISALVMKVARDFFERAVLFLVRNDEARGLAAFGPAAAGEAIGRVARELAVRLDEPSLFNDVVAGCRPWAGALPDDASTRLLLDRLGRFRAGQAALLPLVAHRDTIALLFGDNPETGREPGRLDGLELFMHQAGIAMENALLQKRLRALEEKG